MQIQKKGEKTQQLGHLRKNYQYFENVNSTMASMQTDTFMTRLKKLR